MTYKRYSQVTRVCKKCDLFVSEDQHYKSHVRHCDGTGKIIKGRTKLSKQVSCKVCSKEFAVEFFAGCDYKQTCSNECKNIAISNARKKFLKENPDKCHWKSSKKFISTPCENVKKYLIEHGIDFIEEFRPLEERAFCIDIAFPHIKIGIEINGTQHYNKDGTLKPYYQERHDLIEAAGWKLIEVFYTECFSDEDIAKFLNFEIPRDEAGVIEYIRDKMENKKQKKQKYKGMTLSEIAVITNREKLERKWADKKNIIFGYGIDFGKRGWQKQVAGVLGICANSVNRWMRRHHPDFYRDHCFIMGRKLTT